MTECTHRGATSARAELAAQLPQFVGKLAFLGSRAMGRCDFDPQTIEQAERARDDAIALTADTDWSVPAAKATLFRLLAVATWPAAAGDDSTCPLSVLLGSLFDSMSAKPHRLRPLANAWVRFSRKWVRYLHDAWNEVIQFD